MKTNIDIRSYKVDDRKEVQGICIATGPGEAKEQKAFQDILLTVFCNYYIDQEAENCFVAAEEEKVVGYVLCAEDSKAWAKTFQEKYVSNTEDSEIKAFSQGVMVSPLKYVEEYPAHLHIDILADYQRMGIGSRLMDTLISHLKSKEVPGVMFSVASDNEKGINFYNKYGFKLLGKTPHEIVMGMKLK